MSSLSFRYFPAVAPTLRPNNDCLMVAARYTDGSVTGKEEEGMHHQTIDPFPTFAKPVDAHEPKLDCSLAFTASEDSRNRGVVTLASIGRISNCTSGHTFVEATMQRPGYCIGARAFSNEEHSGPEQKQVTGEVVIMHQQDAASGHIAIERGMQASMTCKLVVDIGMRFEASWLQACDFDVHRHERSRLFG